MNVGWIVKLNFLILALFLVFMLMGKVQQPQFVSTLAEILGVAPNPAPEEKATF